jgi:hypothetical protein
MHPIVLTYTNGVFIRHNTTLKISFTLTVHSEFIDFSGVKIHNRMHSLKIINASRASGVWEQGAEENIWTKER